MKWSKQNDLIATACGDNSLHIFKFNSASFNRLAENQNGEGLEEPVLTLLCHQKDAHLQDSNCVDWNPFQPNFLASCSDDGFVKLWRYVDN